MSGVAYSRIVTRRVFLANTPPVGPRRLKHIEAVLHALRAAGLKDRDAARAAYHLNNVVTEFAADEARFAAYVSSPGSSRRKILAEARRQFQSLPETNTQPSSRLPIIRRKTRKTTCFNSASTCACAAFKPS